MERIQKIIAASGYTSRRKAEDLIAAGKVKVNGKVASIGQSASEKDTITIDGKKLPSPTKRYILLYKPKGYVSTTADKFEKKIVTDLVNTKEKLYPVGRLDKDTEGLLLLTNDGDFANNVIHPSNSPEKVYNAIINKPLKQEDEKKLLEGVRLEDGDAKAEKISTLTNNRKSVSITIHEGRKRIIRRMLESLGYKIINLKRTRIGPITLRGLEPGKYRELRKKEIEILNTYRG